MRDFKRFWKRAGKTVLFFVILFALLFGLSKKIEGMCIENDNLVQDRNKSAFRILREPENSIDMVVVGDSLSYSSVSPMELWENHGIASYVCGQPGQKIQETYHMLKTVFQRQSPKVIVLETNVMFREKKGGKVTEVKESLHTWLKSSVPVFQGHDVWKVFVMGKEYTQENYKGFGFRCKVGAYSKGNYMKRTKKYRKMPDAVIRYMGRIEKLCRQNDAELVLVSTPSPVNYNGSRHNSLAAYAKKHKLAYLDMNLKLLEVGIDWKTDTLDKGDHLNLSGARKVSRYLGEYLSEKTKLPDHRGEAAYASWQQMSERYKEKAEKHLKVMERYHEKKK